MNISSAVVYAAPGQVDLVETGLAQIIGVELHASSPEGKIIVTIESADEAASIEIYERIGQLDGVMSMAMAYQQTESEPDKEI